MSARNYDRKQARDSFRDFCKGLQEHARQMGKKVPRAIWAPGPGRMLTAGQYVKAWKIVKDAEPDREFNQSFDCWYPKSAQEIHAGELMPALHERINIRGAMEALMIDTNFYNQPRTMREKISARAFSVTVGEYRRATV